MGTGVLIFLAMTVAMLVFSSFGLLFYKLLPPSEPLLPLHHVATTTLHTNIRRAPPQRYKANFMTINK